MHITRLLTSVALLAAASAAFGDVTITGDRRVGSPITLTFTGPATSETAQPNPFRDVRIDVEWKLLIPNAPSKLDLIGLAGGWQDPRKKEYLLIPAHFAADGNAAESGATGGDIWRSHFVPSRPGRWQYTIIADQDREVAISPIDPKRKTTELGEGVVVIAEDDDARGMLRYVHERYLRFDNGEPFLKAGVDSPENLLAYADFDGTSRSAGHKVAGLGDRLHRYEPHVKDWREGDPTWRGGRGKGIIGAINYLADVGVNSVYFITMNIGGDGRDVWPYVSDKPEHRDRFDCSKLDQWGIVFDHMSRRGVMLHILLQEAENDQLLDNGDLGPHRKVYLREMVARFAHHPMLTWNLGEENTQTTAQQKAMADYIRSLDPYGHPIVVHTYPNQHEKVYAPLLGHASIDGPSVQTDRDVTGIHRLTKDWIARSAKAGHPWLVCIDEPGSADIGAAEDGYADAINRRDMLRHALWGNLMAGGAGVEWYFGYKRPHNDLNLEDFRSRDELFKATAAATKLFRDRLPFAEMESADELVKGDGVWCLAKPDEVYAVYVPARTAARITLPQRRWMLRWFDPTTGREKPPPGEPDQFDGGDVEVPRPSDTQDWFGVITPAE